MIATGNDRTIREVLQSVEIGETHFEVVKEFVYLMIPKNDVSLEVQPRIQTANRCFSGLRKQQQSSHLSRQKKFTTQTLIHPVLLYVRRTDCSYLRERFSERNKIRFSENRKGVYRRRYNHELDNVINSPNALNFTKTSRFPYAGNIIRRPEDLPQKTLFRAKPNGRRNQGRPKSRWAD
jgi:hypothetical protein